MLYSRRDCEAIGPRKNLQFFASERVSIMLAMYSQWVLPSIQISFPLGLSSDDINEFECGILYLELGLFLF
jgi:hypothetical protein